MDDLILRSLRGLTTSAEEAQLRAWLTAAPENEQHYRDLAAISWMAPRLDAAHVSETPPPASKLIEQAERRAGLGLEAGRARRHAISWRDAIVAAASVAAVVLGVFLYVAQRSVADGQPHEVVAGSRENITVVLQDGSVVRLAPGSRLRIDPRQTREVALEGRAFFAVARSPDRAFRVRTRAGDAVVLGTRFELRIEDDVLRLLVVEGHVALDAGGNRVDVPGGQVSRIVAGTISAPEPVANGEAHVDWLGQFLVFQATPLPQVAGELERVYGVRVVVADSGLVKQSITGWYSDKKFEEVFEIICRVLDARCSLTNGVATIRAQPRLR